VKPLHLAESTAARKAKASIPGASTSCPTTARIAPPCSIDRSAATGARNGESVKTIPNESKRPAVAFERLIGSRSVTAPSPILRILLVN